MVLHAGLDTTAAGLNTRAGSLHLRLACFDDRDTIQQSLLAGLGELGEVILDARPDAALAGLQPRAVLLDLCPAGLANRRLLRHAIGWSQKQQEMKATLVILFTFTSCRYSSITRPAQTGK